MTDWRTICDQTPLYAPLESDDELMRYRAYDHANVLNEGENVSDTGGSGVWIGVAVALATEAAIALAAAGVWWVWRWLR